MEKILFQKGTEFTPQIELNSDNGEITIKGRIFTVDCESIFQPIFKWFNNYVNSPASKTQINIQLEYFNTISTKYLIIFLRKIETELSNINEAKVIWFYDIEDEDMLEIAEDFQAVINIPFEFVGTEYN